jgi:hypothetical protein
MEKLNQWLTPLTNVGVLVGIALLIYELNQNTALTRAEIHEIRAEAKTERQMYLANDGRIASIAAKLFQAGFPQDRDAMAALSYEERFRYGIFIEGLKEAVANWFFQCQLELLDEELCAAGYPAEARSLVIQAHAAGIDLTNMRDSFIADLRRLAEQEDLPMLNEDGTWRN